jgi:tetratricopeptide (TPR) repeat protein
MADLRRYFDEIELGEEYESPGRTVTEADKKAARPHYETGATEYNLGHFEEAIAQFEQAYELDHSPILLFNSTFPPCSSAQRFTSNRPSPVPGRSPTLPPR